MTMGTLRVHDVLKDRILVSRDSARLLEDALKTAIASTKRNEDAGCAASVVVDFEGVEGVAPSFLDELLLIFQSLIGVASQSDVRRLTVAHPPTRLSLKFEAVARGHAMSVQALPDGSWLLTDARKEP